jgi:hypothetical protein
MTDIRRAAVAVVSALVIWGTVALFDFAGAGPFDRPFSRGGALSIDKPFDKGGSLSIDKPLNRGGSLSINQVYVPQKLKIRHVKSVQEIIFPICWGSPQKCREPVKRMPGQKPGQTINDGYPYYIVARFTCLNRKTGEPAGTECDVTIRSKDSCQLAWDAMLAYLDGIFDHRYEPCARCSEIRDPTIYWDGARPDYIQGGQCSGYALAEPGPCVFASANHALRFGGTPKDTTSLTQYQISHTAPVKGMDWFQSSDRLLPRPRL